MTGSRLYPGDRVRVNREGGSGFAGLTGTVKSDERRSLLTGRPVVDVVLDHGEGDPDGEILYVQELDETVQAVKAYAAAVRKYEAGGKA